MQEVPSTPVLRIVQDFAAVDIPPAIAITSDERTPALSDEPQLKDEEVDATASEADAVMVASTEGDFVAVLIFTALTGTRLTIPALEIDVDRGGTRSGLRNMIANGLQLQNLRSVTIVMPGTTDHAGYPSSEILDLVRASSDLESLDILWKQCWNPLLEERIFRTIMMGFISLKLRHLALREMDLSTPALLAALQSTGVSLRKLEIIDVKLAGDLTCADPLVWMAQKLELEEG